MTPFYDRCPDCDERPTCCCQFDLGRSRADIADAKRVAGIVAFFVACAVLAAVTLGVL